MQSFQELDSLLQIALDNFQKDEKELPYLSSSDIVLSLHKKSEKLIEFRNVNKLQKKLKLTRLELNIILILFAIEIDSKYERIYAYLQDNLNLNYPTVQLLVLLLGESEAHRKTLYDYFIKPSKLTLLKFIEFSSEDSNEFLFKQKIYLSASTRNYLLGDNYLEGTLKEYAEIIEPKQTLNSKNLEVEKYIEQGIANTEPYFINIYGKEIESKKEKILNISSYFKHGLLCINTKELLETEKSLTATLPYLVRDALLTGTLLYFESFENYLFSEESNESKLFQQLEQLSWLTFFSTTKKWHPKEHTNTVNFHAFEAKKSKTSTSDEYCITSNNCFNDLVLPKKQKEVLQDVITHYKYQNKVFQEWGYEQFFQSKGISLLFSGSSGTGKTLTASVIANILGLELYKIDLSKIVSKYIGETEKHLSKLFDEAHTSNSILFFDEADSIFGKRSEVQDAHDRYANIEVSYLLQKIEEYDGIVILASNFKENIDEAFLRRLRFVIEFPTPDASQRKVLWEKLLPLKLLNEPINFILLAKRFKLSGANIRNIALYAAFNAAGESSKITMKHILKALESELKKTGKVYNEENLKDLES